MKRFIIISLLVAVAAPMFGCLWIETHNYYLFSVYDSQEFKERVDRISTNNWRAYLGIGDDEYFWFDAERIIDAARQKNDDLMVSYVEQLTRYLDCARSVIAEQWDYPTKDELAQRKQILLQVRAYALGKVKTRLRSQHALLYMRCNMLLGLHAENVSFWEQTASQFIETVYKDMMKNIYAGALLKTGKADFAGQMFAEMGDWSSLMTQYYKKRSFEAIRQEYMRDANSAVLPFLLQDFVNNGQEAVDAINGQGMEGKLFVRDIQQSEAQQMWQFAGQVVDEGKTLYPAMWKAAQAWLEFLFGNHRKAQDDIDQAVKMDGTDRMKDNARVLRLYISAANAQPSDLKRKSFDSYVAGEMRWLDTMAKIDGHYVAVKDRVVHQVLTERYQAAGQTETTAALYENIGCYEYDNYIDTVNVKSLLRFIDYAKKPASTALDAYLKDSLTIDEVAMNDLVGTKYLRLCQWDEALKWLVQVPLSFVKERGYAPYAAFRHYDVEPWIKRQWLTDDEVYGGRKLNIWENQKVTFAREMQQMEYGVNLLKNEVRMRRLYDLAVRYAQVSYTGDCWYIMRDGKGLYDTLRVNETDFLAKSRALLQEVSRSTDPQMKERALFALSYVYINPDRWYKEEWDTSTYDTYRVAVPKSVQYQAWAALYDYEQANGNQPSDYVSRCDEYLEFLRLHR